MKNQTPRKRPKSPVIKTIEESAPWVLISKAARESGISEPNIRKEGFPLRKFGNADYLRPSEFNVWILTGRKEEPQP